MRGTLMIPGINSHIFRCFPVKGFIKLLSLSNYSQDHSCMEGSPDSLAVSYWFQKCTFSPSALIRKENTSLKPSVL